LHHEPREGAKKQADPRVQCKYCNHEFGGGSARQRGHLTSTKGSGVKACADVPANVKRFYQTLAATKVVKKTEAADHKAMDDLTSGLPALPEAMTELSTGKALLTMISQWFYKCSKCFGMLTSRPFQACV
jgi:DNA-directed RNA polymerase subunit RPC12/RpoP